MSDNTLKNCNKKRKFDSEHINNIQFISSNKLIKLNKEVDEQIKFLTNNIKSLEQNINTVINNCNNQFIGLNNKLDTILNYIKNNNDMCKKYRENKNCIELKIKQLDYTIENLTKEISDLQVHALHGSLYNQNASQEIEKINNENHLQFIYN